MSKRIEIPEALVVFGYVGPWATGGLAWCIPQCLHLGHTLDHPAPPGPAIEEYAAMAGRAERAFLCRITIEPVIDRKGRPITRIVRPK